MKQIVFLVHGMGHHPEGWHTEVESQLKTDYAEYRLSRRTFEERFKIVPINYDDVFRRLLKKWQADANALGEVAEGVGAETVEKLVGWLRNAGDVEDNFAWTHAADVLLYRMFFTVRQEIKTHVGLQVLNAVEESGNASWSVIAHSLGTAVIHDTLDMLWSGKLPDGTSTGWGPAQNKAKLIAMVANVSRVLQTTPKALDGLVRPSAAGEADGGCFSFLNFRHKLDPFTIPKMFRPAKWPTAALEESGAFRHIEIEHIHQANVHSLTHYLSNPAVHIPIFRTLAYRTGVTNKQQEDAERSFDTLDPVGITKGIAIKEALEDIGPGTKEDWQIFRQIWAALEAIKGLNHAP